MSPDVEFRCVDCRRIAPALGDGGYLGTTASHETREADPGSPTFGYYYEPLRLLGIRTYDLEAFWKFLKSHDGHRVGMAGAVDEEGISPEELYWEEEDDDAAAAIDADRERLDEVRAARIASGEFVTAAYEVSCVVCQQSYRAPETDLIKHFESLAVPDDVVEAFLDRWDSPSDPVVADGLAPLVDPSEPFILGLARYLRQHRSTQGSWFRRGSSHNIIARLGVVETIGPAD